MSYDSKADRTESKSVRINPEDIRQGQRVRALELIATIKPGTEGVIDEDFGDGTFMVAWDDLPMNPLPQGYTGPMNYRDQNLRRLHRQVFDQMTYHQIDVVR